MSLARAARAGGFIVLLATTVWALAGPPLFADTVVRRFPYPFSHSVTFASDVDQQVPWLGAAMHRVMNEELGLPITDSIWVYGTSPEASSLFRGPVTMNDSPSGYEGHTVAGLLLREWHRGNIDTLHSWQDDAIPTLFQEPKQPLGFTEGRLSLEVLPAPDYLGSLTFQHLRLYFDASPPDDMYAVLRSAEGGEWVVSAKLLSKARNVQFDREARPTITEVVVGVSGDVGLSRDMNLATISSVDLIARSCEEGCGVRLLSIARDGFSRRTVLWQTPWLDSLNVRPSLVTSHGGWTFAQNFGPSNSVMTMPRAPGSVYESPLTLNKLVSLGGRPTSHAYHLDLLRRLGVRTLWLYGGRSFGHEFDEPLLPSPYSTFEGFYDLTRTRLSAQYREGDLAAFKAALEERAEIFTGMDLDDFYCPAVCATDQGSLLGLLIATSIESTRIREQIDHIWYTHFGTGDPGFERSVERPLRPNTVRWLERLAGHYYGLSGTMPLARRIWVAPVGTAARYRTVRPLVAEHVSVDPETSEVTITPWSDPVTGDRTPAAVAGTRDLHGITIYVPSAASASAYIDGVRTDMFTRNPPDATGRESISFVSDAIPTEIVERVPLSLRGELQVEGGAWTEPAPVPTGGDEEPVAGSLIVSQSNAVVTWRPERLDLFNITHVQLSYRVSAPDAGHEEGRFFLDLLMENGVRLRAVESAALPSEDPVGLHWQLPPRSSHSATSRHVLPLVGLRRASAGTDLAQLPAWVSLGRVREVRFGLRGATAGTELAIERIRALRPSANGVSPTRARVVSGRVLDVRGRPSERAVVSLRPVGGEESSTSTDANGYFYFFNQPDGMVGELRANVGAVRCAPPQGELIWFIKDELELDIDLRDCR